MYEYMIQPLVLYVGAPFVIGSIYTMMKGIIKEVWLEERKRINGGEFQEEEDKILEMIWPYMIFLTIYLIVFLTAVLPD